MGRDALRFVWLALMVGAASGCADDAQQPRAALTREQLLDPTTCKECHRKHFDEWSASMHAYASKDPCSWR